jgi:ABC-type branched-subunit amino acid transport system ATPase component
LPHGIEHELRRATSPPGEREVSDRCLVMGHGRIVFDGVTSERRNDAAIRRERLDV